MPKETFYGIEKMIEAARHEGPQAVKRVTVFLRQVYRQSKNNHAKSQHVVLLVERLVKSGTKVPQATLASLQAAEKSQEKFLASVEGWLKRVRTKRRSKGSS